jgi:MoaA/NifB/PqqE/SkfB family radical SAM enzyme
MTTAKPTPAQEFPWKRRPVLTLPLIDATERFRRQVGPIEHTELDECPTPIRNIGWTLGNDCPYRCTHCYSMTAREKGMDFTPEIVDRVVEQLAINGVETVNLGGNEPLFTNVPNPRDTLLPRIIHGLVDAGIPVGLTTSGITLIHLARDHHDAFERLNDVDVSLDSPYPDEHNHNRGAKLYKQAIQALELCVAQGIPHSVIMCAMGWNFTPDRIDALVEVAHQHQAHIRTNPIKPVEAAHMESALPADQYYAGFSRLLAQCSPVDLGEPPIAAVTGFAGVKGCPCGRTSFRIHSSGPCSPGTPTVRARSRRPSHSRRTRNCQPISGWSTWITYAPGSASPSPYLRLRSTRDQSTDAGHQRGLHLAASRARLPRSGGGADSRPALREPSPCPWVRVHRELRIRTRRPDPAAACRRNLHRCCSPYRRR